MGWCLLHGLCRVCVQVDHLRTFIMFRFSMGFVDTLIAKCESCTVIISLLACNESFRLFPHRHCDSSGLLGCQSSLSELGTPEAHAQQPQRNHAGERVGGGQGSQLEHTHVFLCRTTIAVVVCW